MKILVTGASGFIGSFIVEEGLKQGFEVWAGVRGSSSRKFLPDERVNFVQLDFSSKARLVEQLQAFKAGSGRWDYIVHAAGVTKCLDKKEFFKVNYEGTKNFVDALTEAGMQPRKFIYMSSLSIYGPQHEEMPYLPIKESDVPAPNTAYGKSKLLAERYIQEKVAFPYVILRPTGVYGPRERDYFQMAVSIKNHVDFSVGYRPQVITFIYVKDLVKAVYLSIEKPVDGRCYFVSDPQGYDSRAFSDLIQRELGIRRVLHIKAPLWLLRVISLCAGWLSRLTGKPATLNGDKYKIMKQRNWLCDTTPIERELGFTIDYPLEAGVKESINWYKKEKWL
jgi:UDP-glucose 4-epimerase